MANDLRKEQIDLLRFEETLKAEAQKSAAGKAIDRAALAGGLVAVSAAAASAADKLGSETPLEVASAAQSVLNAAPSVADATLIKLADVISQGHALVETMAHDAGLRLLQANGVPKGVPPVAGAVKSILGLG